jgi:hypothetical protein
MPMFLVSIYLLLVSFLKVIGSRLLVVDGGFNWMVYDRIWRQEAKHGLG